MAKKTLTGPGLEPETSGLTHQRSSHLSYPALWMVAAPNSQLVLAFIFHLFSICLNTIDYRWQHDEARAETMKPGLTWVTLGLPLG